MKRSMPQSNKVPSSTPSAAGPRDMSEADFLGRIRRLLPELRERAADAERMRRIPDETVQAFRREGLFRALQPKRYGGYELDPGTYFEGLSEIATACASSSWVLGILGVHSWMIALYPEQAQEDVWGADPNLLVCSSLAPRGNIERVKGGFQLSGRWTFSSGCDPCQWALIGGLTPSLRQKGSAPQWHFFLVPRADYSIEDHWHVMGLSGSGSKDLLLQNAFVPEHRALSIPDAFEFLCPGLAIHASPLFRLPLGFIFPQHMAAAAVGAARGALEVFHEGAKARIWARDKAKVSVDPFVHLRLAKAAAAIDAAQTLQRRNIDALMALARAGKELPVPQRARYRWYTAYAARLSIQAVDHLMDASGASAILLSNPIQRFFRDIHSIGAHVNANEEKMASIFGRSEFDIPPHEPFF